MNSSPRAFLSHSHQDRALANDVATRLRGAGVDVWLDAWEILPGDSIVQKIFEEGLRECKLFIILLTQASINSSWVRHELDSAIVQRLSGATRVVPVLGEPCDIPVALRTLLRLDLTIEGIESVVTRLVDTAFGRDQKPALGPAPTSLAHDVPGISRTAGGVAMLLSASMDQDDGSPIAYDGEEISQRLSLSAEQVNDAVDELVNLGLAKVSKFLGTAPYDFGSVEPTASLAFHLRGTGALEYDPEDDVRMVAAAVVQGKSLDGEGIQMLTKLSPSRINRAVCYLEDYGLADVQKYLGTAPFDFGEVDATAATRRFVTQNSR